MHADMGLKPVVVSHHCIIARPRGGADHSLALCPRRFGFRHSHRSFMPELFGELLRLFGTHLQRAGRTRCAFRSGFS